MVVAVPVVVVPLGAAVGLWREPRRRYTSLIQHLAAGLLIGAVALELLAPVSHGSPLAAVIGVGAGVVVVLVVDAVSARLSGGRQSGGVGMAAAVGVDLTIDGFLLGVATTTDLRLGLLLAVGLAVEDFFTALSLTAGIRQSVRRRTALGLTAAVTAAMAAGVVAGVLVAPVLGQFGYHTVLAFGAVAVLFLVVEELLREAHRARETPWATSALFAGLLGFLVMHMLI